MYDTLVLSSPSVREAAAQQITDKLDNQKHVARRTRSGAILDAYVLGHHQMNHGVSITISVHRKRPVRMRPTVNEILRGAGAVRKPRTRTVWSECPPYITVEGSVHKMLLGHNVTGGPRDFQPAANWFVNETADRLGVSLPPAASWEVHRVDYAETFDLAPAAIGDFLEAANRAVYGRRTVKGYGRESVHCRGRTVTVKVYHKGPELLAHDALRLRGHMSEDDFALLLKKADCTLRVESTIWALKLRSDLFLMDRNPLVSEILDAHIEAIHREEVFRLLKEGRFGQQPVVRHPDTVIARLFEMYSQRMADRLVRTWAKLVGSGEAAVREAMTTSTFLDHRAKLIAAGCAWLGSHARVERCLVPDGFTISPEDPRCCREEAPEVISNLRVYRS